MWTAEQTQTNKQTNRQTTVTLAVHVPTANEAGRCICSMNLKSSQLTLNTHTHKVSTVIARPLLLATVGLALSAKFHI